MEVTRCSIDRLTILGYAHDNFEYFVKNSIFLESERFAKLPYTSQWTCVDGSLLQYGEDDKKVRYDFNPNKVRGQEHEKEVYQLLKVIKHATLSRIDIALDFENEDLGRYEWLDYKTRKRNYWTTGHHKLQTLYIGSKDSEWKLRIYDKAEEQKDRTGRVWWRVEAQLRGHYAEMWEKINPFEDVHAVKPRGLDEGHTIQTRAMLEFLINNPKEFDKLSKNAKTKYKQLLGAYAEPIPVSMQTFYEQKKSDLLQQVQSWLNFCPITV